MYCMKGEGEKKRHHVVQPFGTEVVRSCKGVCRDFCRNCFFAAKDYACALHALCLFTLDSSQIMVIIENIFQTQCGVLLTESRIYSLCTRHAF